MKQPLPNHHSRIEELEKKLYAKENNLGQSNRIDLRPKSINTKDRWQDKVETGPNQNIYHERPRRSIFGYILFLAILFFAASLGYAGYTYWKGTQMIHADNVDLKILSPISIGGGEKLALDIIVQNNNQIALETVDLIMEYPIGTKNPDNLTQDQKRVRESLGDMPSGSTKKKTVESVLFGEEGETKKIIFTLEYRVPGSTAIFEKRKEFEIALNAAPIRLNVVGQKEISSGQELTLKFDVESNNVEDLKKVLVRVDYPFGFKFKNSSVDPVLENNVWLFENLKPKEKRTVEIVGVMEGQNEEERIFKFDTGLAKNDSPNEIEAVLTSYVHDVSIQKSFVGLDIKINDNLSREVSLTGNQRVTGEILFKNNTNDLISDLSIELEISGEVINEATFEVENGYYDSNSNKIFWTSQTNPDLFDVGPRESDFVRFEFELFELGNKNKIIVNPEIRINVRANGERLAQSNVEEKVYTEESKLVRFVSDTNISVQSQYERGPIVNAGPVPPKAEQETTYTVAMSVSNSSNVLSGAEITGVLPLNVSWKDVISPEGTNITFDPGTRTFKWSIGEIKQGVGFNSLPMVAYLKVGLVPSLSDVGSELTIVENIKFKANDSFAKNQIQKNPKNITTFLNEKGYGNEHQIVIK